MHSLKSISCGAAEPRYPQRPRELDHIAIQPQRSMDSPELLHGDAFDISHFIVATGEARRGEAILERALSPEERPDTFVRATATLLGETQDEVPNLPPGALETVMPGDAPNKHVLMNRPLDVHDMIDHRVDAALVAHSDAKRPLIPIQSGQ